MSEYTKVKVAAVQAAPIFLDRTATTKKACDLIHEVGRNGAELAVFPEGYIPAHPTWFHHHPATSVFSNALSMELFKNSVEIPGPETDALCAAAKAAGVFVIMGVCERISNTLGTMYNTQIFIDERGRLLGKHQKFMPTVGERMVHTGGFGNTLHSFQTTLGQVSALVCGENSNPLAVFALTAENTRIHGMSWPNYFALSAPPMRHRVELDSRAFAVMSGAHVVSACGVVDKAMLEKLQLSTKEMEVLADPAYSGGSLIVDPEARIIAGPLGSEEDIAYGECDFDVTIRAKLRQDFSGHYNRPDIFQLQINRDAPRGREDLSPQGMAVQPIFPLAPEVVRGTVGSEE
ncbi:MAG: carbon-nitrogen hydrolase family protein [Hydrogenophaga sp.]|uniref:carbon-nitrogen hydrolase family protein n=1 Tax=Hydrogenophaga sp. TaxID=1904254 RepID=UPI0040367ADD